MEHIEAHPQKHRQDRWAIRQECGTVGCFAYHAATLTEWTAIIEPDGDGFVCTKDGTEYQIAYVARIELGLSYDQSDRLFDTKNSVEDLRAIVDEIIAGES